jgi:hypothetical protein
MIDTYNDSLKAWWVPLVHSPSQRMFFLNLKMPRFPVSKWTVHVLARLSACSFLGRSQ